MNKTEKAEIKQVLDKIVLSMRQDIKDLDEVSE